MPLSVKRSYCVNFYRFQKTVIKDVINTKMEKGQPPLRVPDAETGTVHFEWSLTRISKILEESVIPPDDFLHPDRYEMNLLIRIFLLSCIESLHSCNNNQAREIQTSMLSSH